MHNSHKKKLDIIDDVSFINVLTFKESTIIFPISSAGAAANLWLGIGGMELVGEYS